MRETRVAPGCLAGIRLLDLSQFEAGPSCTGALAWLGAEVVKVENPKGGEPGRMLHARQRPQAQRLLFHDRQRQQEVGTVDLKSDRGLALVKEMAKQADVFAAIFAPGVMERLGFGWDELRTLNPRLIYIQASRSDLRSEICDRGGARPKRSGG
jgi:formyl-CoA transferase